MRHDEFHIILDILYEENHYTSTVQREIKNELLIVDDDPKYYATVPSINCILGDKLTAFAPHTTGIPIDAKKELEIMKQLFDVATLTDEMDDFSEVKANYRAIAKQEIEYRGLEITYEDVLKDTIRSAACIIGKGTTDKEDLSMLFCNYPRKPIVHEPDDLSLPYGYSIPLQRSLCRPLSMGFFCALLLSSKEQKIFDIFFR